MHVAWLCDAVAASAAALGQAHGVTAVPMPHDLAQPPPADGVFGAQSFSSRVSTMVRFKSFL